MSDLRLQMVFEAVDRASAPMRQIVQSINTPVAMVQRMASSASQAIQRVGQSAAGIAAMVGGGVQLRELSQQNDYFTRLRINSGRSEEAIERFREKLLDTAYSSRISLGELMEAFKATMGSGGSLDFFEQNMGVIATGIQSLGGHGAELGEMFGNLKSKMNIGKPDETIQVLATMREQFRGVADAMDNFAASAPLLLSTYNAMGHTGTRAATEVSALFSMISRGVASPRQARSVTEGFLSMLGDPEQAKRVMGLGVEVYADADRTRTRPVTDIVKDLIQRYTENPYRVRAALGSTFDQAFKIPIAEIQQTGKSETLDRLLNAKGDPAKLAKDAADAMQGLTASINALHTAIQKFGESTLAKPIQMLADVVAGLTGPLAYMLSALAGLAVLGTIAGWLSSAVAGFVSFAGWIAKLGPIIAQAAAFVTSFFAALQAGTGVMAAFGAAAAANPIGLVVLAIVALGASIYLLWRNWDTVVVLWRASVATLGKIWDDIVAGFDKGVIAGLANVVRTFDPVTLFANGINALVKYLTGVDLRQDGARLITSFGAGIKEGFLNLLPDVGAMVDKLRSMLPSFRMGPSSGESGQEKAGDVLRERMGMTFGPDRGSPLPAPGQAQGEPPRQRVELSLDINGLPAGARVGVVNKSGQTDVNTKLGYVMGAF